MEVDSRIIGEFLVGSDLEYYNECLLVRFWSQASYPDADIAREHVATRSSSVVSFPY